MAGYMGYSDLFAKARKIAKRFEDMDEDEVLSLGTKIVKRANTIAIIKNSLARFKAFFKPSDSGI